MIVAAKNYLEVIKIKYLGEYSLELSFNDDSIKVIDLANLLHSPPPLFLYPLNQKKTFKKFILIRLGEYLGNVARIYLQNI